MDSQYFSMKSETRLLTPNYYIVLKINANTEGVLHFVKCLQK